MITKLTIDRFEEDRAVLKTEEGLSVIWPKNKLPENATEGMVLNFSINNNEEAKVDREQKAKDILNEILNTE